MPTFEYQCDHGHYFEDFSFKIDPQEDLDKNEHVCPECGSTFVVRTMKNQGQSAPFKFKLNSKR